MIKKTALVLSSLVLALGLVVATPSESHAWRDSGWGCGGACRTR